CRGPPDPARHPPARTPPDPLPRPPAPPRFASCHSPVPSFHVPGRAGTQGTGQRDLEPGPPARRRILTPATPQKDVPPATNAVSQTQFSQAPDFKRRSVKRRQSNAVSQTPFTKPEHARRARPPDPARRRSRSRPPR